MGPVVNNAATVNKSGDSRPNNSSNHGPSSHGSYAGGNHSKNYGPSYRQKPSHTNNQNHRQSRGPVNNQQTTQPGRQHNHHNQQHNNNNINNSNNNNVPPPSQNSHQQPQSLPQPSQHPSATMFVSSQQQPSLQHQQQQKPPHNHQASIPDSVNVTNNAGNNMSITPNNKNSQTSSNVLQQQHTSQQQQQQQQSTIQMPIAPDKTSTAAVHNPHMVHHQQPTPTSTNTGVGSVNMNQSHMPSAQPNMPPNLSHHQHLAPHHGHVYHHHQQQQPHHHHHHIHHHHQPNQTQNPHHHNIHNPHNAHPQSHAGQIVGAQLAVPSIIATNQNKPPPQVLQQLTQNQDSSGQQKQQSNQPPQATMHVSSPHSIVDHQHKAASGIQHNVQTNPPMLPINQQANPNHSNQAHMANLQSNPITHQSASGVAPMPQAQQQQPTTHNQPHIQQPSHHPLINQPQQQYYQMHPAFVGFPHGPPHPSQFHQIPNTLNPTGVPLGSNHLGPQPNIHYSNTSPKFPSITQPNFPPHQQNIPAPNASGPLLHQQSPQMHPARQAPTKGPLQMQQQQQHDPSARPPIYHQNYYMPTYNSLPYLMPFPFQQQNSTYITPHGPTNEVDQHITSAYTSPQPVAAGSHMAAISVSQPAHNPLHQVITQPNIPTSNHPTPASSHQASFGRVKESKKISIVDPKTGRALTKEQLLAPTPKTGSVTSSTPATDDLTRSSISGSPEVRPTSASSSSSPVEQSSECSASATKVAGPTKPDDKVDSNVDKAQSDDISEKSVISRVEEDDSPVDQEKSTCDVSKSAEPNQINQDISKTEVAKDKDETSKPQAIDVCDNAAASSETITIGLQRLNLADNIEKRSDIDEISGDVAEKLGRQGTDICTTEQNSVDSQTSDEQSKEKTTVDEDNSEGQEDARIETSDKQSNHDSSRKESLENNSTDVGSNASRALHLDLGGEELSADKVSVSSSFPSSNKLSSMPQSEASTPTQNEEKETKQESATPDTKSELTYEEGQFSPTNPDGRRKYSRDFLRKVALVMGLSCHARPPVRSNELKEPPNFAPPFLMNSGYNQFNRDTAQRRLSQQVNNKPRRIIATTSFQQEVELKTAKNPWKPDLAKSPNETEAEKIDTDRLIKIFRGHLNKLTPQKYDQLIEKIKLLDLGTSDRMNRVIDLVFDKAVDEPNFCELYANLCKVVGTKTTDDSSTIFSYALVKKCQKEFENEDIYDGLNVIERQEEIEATTDSQKRKQLMDELYEEQRLRRRKYLGTIKLIGEMYKLDLLLPVIIGVCMHRLIESPTSENLECLCSLILTVGAKLNASEDVKVREGLSNTLTAMQNIASNKANLEKLSLDVRIKFKILDILEFRKRGWKPRNQENNPKKIDEIHREAAQETLLKNSISQRSLADRKNNEEMRRKASVRQYEQTPSLLNELTKNSANNQTSRLGILTTESSNSVQSLKPHSYSRPSPMNHSSPNQNSDVIRLAPLNPLPLPNSTNTSKPNPDSRQTNQKPITTQSNVKGSSSLNPANKNISNPIPSDRHTEYQSTESKSVESKQDMVIQMIKGCVSKYDGQFMLEKERLTEHSKTILSLLHKGDVSNDSIIMGITDYVEQLDYPTHLLGDIFEHMIFEGLFTESDFSTRFTESRWSKARDSSPKFIRYLSEPEQEPF